MIPGTKDDGDYKRTAYIGINKTGKSSRMIETLDKSYDYAIHRVVILIRTTPDAYRHIDRLKTYDDLKGFKCGIALFWDYTCEPEEMLRNIVSIIDEGEQNGKKYLQNGGLVLEDASDYLEHNPARPIRIFIGGHRMYHLDLYFTVHSWKDVPSFLRRRMNMYRIFKTLDTFKNAARLEALDFPNSDNLHRAWVEVMNSPNNYHNLTIRTGK